MKKYTYVAHIELRQILTVEVEAGSNAEAFAIAKSMSADDVKRATMKQAGLPGDPSAHLVRVRLLKSR